MFADAVETGEELGGECLACFDGRGDGDLAGVFEKFGEFLAEAHGLTVNAAEGCEFLTDFLALWRWDQWGRRAVLHPVFE